MTTGPFAEWPAADRAFERISASSLLISPEHRLMRSQTLSTSVKINFSTMGSSSFTVVSQPSYVEFNKKAKRAACRYWMKTSINARSELQ